MQSDQELGPWSVSALGFPGHDAAVAQRLRFLVNYAILAPSGHNAQPWLFRINGEKIALSVDRSRALPVVDPHDRELTISCGAALFNLRVAARHFGYWPVLELLPDADSPDLLARMGLGERRTATHEENTLFAAIPRRRTCRLPFERAPIDRRVLEQIVAAAQAEGVWMHVVKDRKERHALAEMIADGDRLQFADKRFRRELAAWVHSNRSHSRDGMPGRVHGMGVLMSLLAPFVIRAFDLGKTTAARDEDLADHAPALLVLGTSDDEPSDWLRAGLALQHALLHATAAGLSASFFDQPVEVESLRPRLGRLIDRTGFPQLVLRIGHGPAVAPTPRRSVADVVRG